MHLVLNSYGASIRQHNATFEVTTAKGKQSIHPRDVKTITIAKAARISSDAVLLAIQHEIDVLFVDNMGMPKGRIWSVKYGSISDIRRKQLEFFYSPAAVPWVKNMILDKMNNQVAMLLSIQLNATPHNQDKISRTINSIEDYKRKVRKLTGESVSDIAPTLRGWEGAAANKYFQAISLCLPTDYQFQSRTRLPAKDYFNCMLNYGYGMLYGKIEAALIKAGIDPYVGIFHRDDYNRPALVFDVIEKFRIWIDYVIIQLALQQAMSPECFTKKEGGGLWLDGLGKRIVIQSINDYFAEIININGLERSRAEHLQKHAHRLAQTFLNQAIDPFDTHK